MEFTLSTLINATAKEIYTAWLSSKRHTDMTGGEAECSSQEGEKFTAWDGYIWGENIKLKPFNKIIQSWRTDQFEENENDSQIEILLEEKNGNTEIILIHTNLPESGEHYRKGWEEHYFKPMREYFNKKII